MYKINLDASPPVTQIQPYERENSLFFAAVGLLHIPLALLMREFPLLSTIHALLVLGMGLWFVLHDNVPTRAIYVTGYLVGAEVLWRMTQAGVFWEFSKYAFGLLLILALIKWRMALRSMPIFYLLILLPSALLTLLDSNFNFDGFRQDVSFNLSGHFTLAITVIFFSRIQITTLQLRTLLLYMLLPILSAASLALYSTLSASIITFSLNSNFTTSGGFGPNQVSAILGLGALLGWIWLLTSTRMAPLNWAIGILSLWMLAQSALTFSRGGMLNFVIAGSSTIFFILMSRRFPFKIFFPGVLLMAIAAVVMALWLNSQTEGALLARFTETGTTGRTEIIQADLYVWRDNLLFGVGPGHSQASRLEFIGLNATAHTEYTRLLSEHGLMGLLALIFLTAMPAQRLWHVSNMATKGILLGFVIWSLVDMSHAAMRLAAVSYVYGLAFIDLKLDD